MKTNCVGRVALLGYAMFMLLACGVRAQAIDTLASRIDALVKPYVQGHDFSGAVLIAQNDAVLFHKAYGMASYEHGVPNTTDTKFRVGSVTKQFTAAAILLLQQQGVLQVNDTLSRFWPDFPVGNRITLHQLLTHTAGLARDPFEDEGALREYHTLDEVLQVIQEKPLIAEPGAQMQYSNCGFIVLAAVIEQVSGQSYAAFLEEHIFEPLGMDRSGIEDDAALVPGMASGYDPGWGAFGRMATPQAYQANLLGASGLYTTVGDLYRWSKALTTDILLTESSREAMLTNHARGRGYGIGVFNRFGRRVVGHDGVTYGFTAAINYYSDEEVIVVFATNMRTGVVSVLENGLAAVVFDETYTPYVPPAPGLVSNEIGHYTGRYELFPGFYLDVSRHGSHLMLAGTAGYPTLLTPLDSATFFYRALYARIRFEPATDTQPERLVWVDRRGQAYPATRISP